MELISRKQYEDLLAAAELLNLLAIAIDKEGKIIYFNKTCEEKFSFSQEEVKEKYIWEALFSEEEREKVQRLFSKSNWEDMPESLRATILTKKKETKLIAWTINVFSDLSKTEILLIGRDISATERRIKLLELLNAISREIITSSNLQESMQAISSMIRAVLDAHCVLIFSTDHDRKMMTPIGWNWRPGYYNFPDSLLVPRLPRTTDKGLVGWVIREGKELISGETERDPRGHHIEGTEYHDESAIAAPLKFKEEVKGAIFVSKVGLNQFSHDDLSILETIAGSLAQALYNQELFENLEGEEKNLLNLFESIPNGVIIHDLEGKILMLNPIAGNILGYLPEELLGKDISQIRGFSKQEEQANFVAEILQKGRAEMEVINYRKDGTEIPLEIVGAPINFRGKPAILSISRDLSEQKKLEKMKEDLLYAVSHEMKTPIQALLAASELYSSLPPLRLAARSQELFEIVQRNVVRLQQLINNFLESQKLASQAIILNKNPVLLEELALQAQKELSPYALLNKVQFENQIEENLPSILADSERIKEVFINLYSNAIRFSPLQGIVRTTIKKVGDLLEIEIADQGKGIPEEEIPRLFERFYRPSSPEVRPFAGSGLGLYLAKTILQSHNGEIAIKSEKGQGTTVSFRLPISSD